MAAYEQCLAHCGPLLHLLPHCQVRSAGVRRGQEVRRGQVINLCFLPRHIGPHMMKDREPYDLKSVMLAYNLFQTLFNCWLFCSVSSLAVTVENSLPLTPD